MLYWIRIKHCKPLIPCGNFSQGSRQLHCRVYFSLRTSIRHIHVVAIKKGVDKDWSQTSSPLINRQMKSSQKQVTVGLQYLFFIQELENIIFNKIFLTCYNKGILIHLALFSSSIKAFLSFSFIFLGF